MYSIINISDYTDLRETNSTPHFIDKAVMVSNSEASHQQFLLSSVFAHSSTQQVLECISAPPDVVCDLLTKRIWWKEQFVGSKCIPWKEQKLLL